MHVGEPGNWKKEHYSSLQENKDEEYLTCMVPTNAMLLPGDTFFVMTSLCMRFNYQFILISFQFVIPIHLPGIFCMCKQENFQQWP